jgi:tetratricopeptide (TPR) repeat protein
MVMRITLAVAAAAVALVMSACANAPERPRVSRLALRAGTDTAATTREALERRAEAARAALAAEPDNTGAAVALGDVLLRQARVSGQGGRALEAERVLAAALAHDPERYEARRMLASTYLSLHRFREALREGVRCLAASPNDAVAHGIVGDAHLELGDYEKAFAAFDRMNELKPSAASYARAAYARELQGDLPGALDAMQMALEATPPSDAEAVAWHRAQVGHLFVEMGRTTDAAREFARAADTFPGHPLATHGLAHLAAAAGRHADALALVQTRLNDSPSAADFALAAAQYRALGRADEAERHDRLAEAAWRSDTPEPAQLARFLASREGRASDAVRIAEAAFRDRRDIFTADALAWSYFRADRLEDARAAMAEARRTGTRDRIILEHAAAIDAASLGPRNPVARQVSR